MYISSTGHARALIFTVNLYVGGPDGGRCGGGRYGGGHYGGRRYGGGRYGGAFLKGVDATAEPSDTHFTMDATAEIRRLPCSIAVKACNTADDYVIKTPLSVYTVQALLQS